MDNENTNKTQERAAGHEVGGPQMDCSGLLFIQIKLLCLLAIHRQWQSFLSGHAGDGRISVYEKGR